MIKYAIIHSLAYLQIEQLVHYIRNPPSVIRHYWQIDKLTNHCCPGKVSKSNLSS